MASLYMRGRFASGAVHNARCLPHSRHPGIDFTKCPKLSRDDYGYSGDLSKDTSFAKDTESSAILTHNLTLDMDNAARPTSKYEEKWIYDALTPKNCRWHAEFPSTLSMPLCLLFAVVRNMYYLTVTIANPPLSRLPLQSPISTTTSPY